LKRPTHASVATAAGDGHAPQLYEVIPVSGADLRVVEHGSARGSRTARAPDRHRRADAAVDQVPHREPDVGLVAGVPQADVHLKIAVVPGGLEGDDDPALALLDRAEQFFEFVPRFLRVAGC